MKRMKRLTCALAVLAMVILTHIPAQAEFKGTLQRNQPWSIQIDNSANAFSAGVTVFHLGRRGVESDSFTVPAGGSLEFFGWSGAFSDLSIPKDTRRITIEVDPSQSETRTHSANSRDCLLSEFLKAGLCCL